MAHQDTNRRQINLPLSKAIEISWKSIRMRLSRSMLVTSSIILALAFLCSIMTTEALIEGMRTWTQITPTSDAYQSLKVRRDKLDGEIKSLEAEIRKASQYAPKLQGTVTFDPEKAFDGDDWEDVRERIGRPLPLIAADLNKLLTVQPPMLETVKLFIKEAEELKTIRQELNRPEDLKAQMAGNGVPTEQAEIEGNRVQTRWIITLALLVAFVGILNAMLMSVTERFREIGTMKCLGALDGFIVKLFLLESLFQGTVGTVLGIILGLAVSFGMATLSYGSAAYLNVPWESIGLNVLITLGVGMALSVGGAILPALQAARMEPIAAMRVEA